MDNTPAAPTPRCTIVVVPRERFSLSDESLETILANTTDVPYELVYVDGKSPQRIRAYLDRRSAEKGFKVVRSNHYLSPNQARNLGLQHVSTEYVVFVDNDLFVTPGWLSKLLDCADETGAWVVGPLYYQGDPQDQIIHMATGHIEFSGDAPHRTFSTNQRFQGIKVTEVPEPLQRQTCDYAEFHCMLVRTDAFNKIGPLDEGLLNTREHLDICLRVAEAGGEVWFEPASVVTYKTPPPFQLTDVPFYWLRWSEAWGTSSLDHFCRTYGIDRRYGQRVRNMSSRRQRVFAPLRSTVKKSLGKRADQGVGLLLSKVEPRVNRLVVRQGPKTSSI